MRIIKKILALAICLAISFTLSIPALAYGSISIPNNSKLLGFYTSSKYDYIMISVEKEDFVLYGVWSEDCRQYIGAVAKSGYMSKDHFVASVESYNVMDISQNEILRKVYDSTEVQRTVTQKLGLFNKLKSTTIKTHDDCPTNNGFTQTY